MQEASAKHRVRYFVVKQDPGPQQPWQVTEQAPTSLGSLMARWLAVEQAPDPEGHQHRSDDPGSLFALSGGRCLIASWPPLSLMPAGGPRASSGHRDDLLIPAEPTASVLLPADQEPQGEVQQPQVVCQECQPDVQARSSG